MKQFDDEAMSEFEQELAQAMRHVDAPQGFADRVLAKAAQEPRRAKLLMMPRRMQVWIGGAIAAALLVGAFGVRQERERERRAEEAARAQQAQQQLAMAMQITDRTLSDSHPQQQLEVAMQITGEALANVRAQVQQAGVRLGD